MVWPSTKCEPRSRMACRVAVRTAGRPSRLTSSWRMLSGVSWVEITRAEKPSAQPEEGEPPPRRRGVFAQEVLDPADAADPGMPGADRLDKPAGARVDACLG